MRLRVWFKERWITSIFGLLRGERPVLSRVVTDQLRRGSRVAVLDSRGVLQLDELRLHNGTIYRWNWIVYDVSDDSPHLRVEKPVPPLAGPTGRGHDGQRRLLRRGWYAPWPPKTARSGARCLSRWPRRTSPWYRHGITADSVLAPGKVAHVAEPSYATAVARPPCRPMRQWEADEGEIGRPLRHHRTPPPAYGHRRNMAGRRGCAT